MILSGLKIKEELGQSIFLDPFHLEQLGPNSYNLRLHEDLLVYTESPLDMRKKNPTRSLKIPNEGLLLEPGKLYLGRTLERTKTLKHVPMLEGRSSVGRLGIFIHITAGFGDVGFDGFWTLEISCIQPVRIYAGVEVCQIFFHTILGEFKPYASKYQNNQGIQPSLMFHDFDPSQRNL